MTNSTKTTKSKTIDTADIIPPSVFDSIAKIQLSIANSPLHSQIQAAEFFGKQVQIKLDAMLPNYAKMIESSVKIAQINSSLSLQIASSLNSAHIAAQVLDAHSASFAKAAKSLGEFPQFKMQNIVLSQLEHTETEIDNAVTTSKIKTYSINHKSNELVIESEIETRYVSDGKYVFIKRDDLDSLIKAKNKQDIAIAQKWLDTREGASPEMMFESIKYDEQTTELRFGKHSVTFNKSTVNKQVYSNDLFFLLFSNAENTKNGLDLYELVEFVTGNELQQDELELWKNRVSGWIETINKRVMKEANPVPKLLQLDRGEAKIIVRKR